MAATKKECAYAKCDKHFYGGKRAKYCCDKHGQYQRRSDKKEKTNESSTSDTE